MDTIAGLGSVDIGLGSVDIQLRHGHSTVEQVIPDVILRRARQNPGQNQKTFQAKNNWVHIADLNPFLTFAINLQHDMQVLASLIAKAGNNPLPFASVITVVGCSNLNSQLQCFQPKSQSLCPMVQ